MTKRETYTQREWDRVVGIGKVPEEYREDSIELDPANREWEYDGDGNKIYKLEAGFATKTLFKKS